MSDFLYGDFVRNIAKSFDKALSDIEAVHNFEYGPEFEIAICNTLRTVLPNKFGICRGYVINQAGEMAGDDIIIYERMRFPTSRLLGEDYSRKEKVPIEAVFAYIEAKYTVELDGSDDSSLNKALSQTSDVKQLCEQREKVPLGMISQHIMLGSRFNVSPRAGYPEYRNPMYTAILARRVRAQKNGPLIQNSMEIKKAINSLKMRVINPPDLIVAGTSNVVMPCVRHENQIQIQSPFFIKSISKYISPIAEKIAFGVALSHLLWALDFIELGRMPWGKILANGLGINHK